MKWAVGIDIGGTKIAVSTVSRKGVIKDRLVFHTPSDPQSIESLIIATVKELQTKRNISCIGIGIAAQIDSSTGIVHSSPNLSGWHHVPLQSILTSALHLPVYITNDVSAATIGEWLFGAGKGCQDVVCVFLGTGIGSGIVSNGRLLEGNSHTAGELGHVPVALTNGLKCTCGGIGCLEAYAGGWGIAEIARNRAIQGSKAATFLLNLTQGNTEAITAREVIQGFHQKDPLCIAIIEQAREALVSAGVTVTNLLNPKRIILGGGIMEGLPEIATWMSEGIRRRALRVAVESLEIVPAELKNDAVMIGAAALSQDICHAETQRKK